MLVHLIFHGLAVILQPISAQTGPLSDLFIQEELIATKTEADKDKGSQLRHEHPIPNQNEHRKLRQTRRLYKFHTSIGRTPTRPRAQV